MIDSSYANDILSYEPETGVLRWKVDKGSRARAGQIAGHHHAKDGHIAIFVDGRLYKAHRLAWLIMTGDPPPDVIDHKDRDRSNNRWANLRQATVRLNSANSKVQHTSRLGIKGVTQIGPKSFKASIRKQGKRTHLGCFHTATLASEAYRSAAIAEFGEFARV